MRLEFTDKRINEFKEAHIHITGAGAEVDAKLGAYLLTKTVELDGAEVPMFREVKPDVKENKKKKGE